LQGIKGLAFGSEELFKGSSWSKLFCHGGSSYSSILTCSSWRQHTFLHGCLLGRSWGRLTRYFEQTDRKITFFDYYVCWQYA